MQANFLSSVNIGKTNWIIGLINKSVFCDEFKSMNINLLIEDRLREDEVERLIEKLINNQVDPIEAGHKYTQTDIHRKLKSMGL